LIVNVLTYGADFRHMSDLTTLLTHHTRPNYDKSGLPGCGVTVSVYSGAC